MTWCCENLKNTWCHLIPWRQEPHLRRFPRLLGCLSGIWLRVLDWTGHGLPICQETVFWSRVVTTPGCLAAMIESPVDTCGLLLINICWDGCCPDTCWSFFGRPTVFGIQRKCCISLVMTPNQGAYDPWRYVWYSVARALGLKWMMALGACLKLVMPSTVSVYQSINLLIDCSISLSISICLYLSLSISIYLYLSTSIYLSIYLSFFLSFYLSIFLSLSISFYIFLFLSISIYMFLSIVSDHIFSYLFLSYLSIYIYFHLPAPSQRQRWGGNPREQHPRRSCPWRCAAGFPVSPRTRQQGLDSSWPIHSWFLSKNGSVKSCRLEDDDFLYIIWTTIAFKWMTHISHIHNVQVNLFVHNSFIKCMCVWWKKWTWWPVSAGAVYCAMQFEAINSGQNKKLWQNTREIMPQSYEFSFARPKLHQLQGQSDTTCMQSMSSPETHCRGHPAEQSKVLRDGAAVPKMLLRSNRMLLTSN